MPAPSGAALLGVSASDNVRQTSDLFKKLEQQFKRDERSSREWRRLNKSWYALRDGDQWDADTLTKMRKAQKPAITFNRCNSVIATVCGIQISNRQDVFVYPRSEGDAEVSEIGTEAIRWFDDRCNADTEESRAFRDCLTCGIGATETRMDYLDHQDGKGYRERINPMSCFWDASASKRNLTDAKRVWVVKVMELEEAMELYPDVDPSELDAGWTDLPLEQAADLTDRSKRDYRQDANGRGLDFTKPVRLVQAQWWEREHRFMVTGPDGQEFEVPKNELRLYRGLQQFSIRRIPHKRYHYAIIGSSVIQTGPLDPEGGFTIKFITGQYDEKRGYWYGLVRSMKDRSFGRTRRSRISSASCRLWARAA